MKITQAESKLANPLLYTGSAPSCCKTPAEGVRRGSRPVQEARWITGRIATGAGMVPVVSTRLTARDRWEHVKARSGSFRMEYSLEPGLYAAGSPGSESDVFASANYRMSFNRLREALDGMNAWILVLDTAGINVWCAAGK